MRTLTSLPIVLALFMAAGCAPQASGAAHPDSASPAPSRCDVSRTVVVGLDRSGSYVLATAGIEQVARLIERAACPADRWYIRWIQDDSYPNTAAIDTLSFAPVPPRPSPPANPLARREHLAALQGWNRYHQAFVAERTKAVDLVRGLTPTSDGFTDVVGFFIKADELLATAPTGSQPLVVVTSDLQHNTARDGTFDLHGAQVLLLVFQADDPTISRQLRTDWHSRLLSSGASSVTIRDAMESADQILDAPAVAPSGQ